VASKIRLYSIEMISRDLFETLLGPCILFINVNLPPFSTDIIVYSHYLPSAGLFFLSVLLRRTSAKRRNN